MVIIKTPFRISFFGGGTDYPAWFREHGGRVISTAINKYCYISARQLPPFFEHKHRLAWSKIELVNSFDEIEHPAIRVALQNFDYPFGVSIQHEGDLPARAGLGSSSSFMVGLLHALYQIRGEKPSRRFLADEAIHFEQKVLNDCVGVQDQIAAAHGGFNYINIQKSGDYTVDPMNLSPNRLEDFKRHLMLFFTGTTRNASIIAQQQVKAIPDKSNELHRMTELVDEALSVLKNPGNIEDFGRLLHETWQLKRSLTSGITTSMIDELYATGIAAGALGGKLLGAGGGGFLLFFVPPAKRQAVRNKLKNVIEIPFDFDFGGTEVIFNNEQQETRVNQINEAHRALMDQMA